MNITVIQFGLPWMYAVYDGNDVIALWLLDEDGHWKVFTQEAQMPNACLTTRGCTYADEVVADQTVRIHFLRK